MARLSHSTYQYFETPYKIIYLKFWWKHKITCTLKCIQDWQHVMVHDIFVVLLFDHFIQFLVYITLSRLHINKIYKSNLIFYFTILFYNFELDVNIRCQQRTFVFSRNFWWLNNFIRVLSIYKITAIMSNLPFYIRT